MLLRKDTDRRSKHRFAIQRELRYKVAEDGVGTLTGHGQTIDIGSGGVAFGAEAALTKGSFIELSISWPVLLDESCPMRLIVFGRIIRVQAKRAVCSIDKWEFRTQARTLQAVPPKPRADGMLQRWADGIRKGALKAAAANF
jgi:hypothetical protein